MDQIIITLWMQTIKIEMIVCNIIILPKHYHVRYEVVPDLQPTNAIFGTLSQFNLCSTL